MAKTGDYNHPVGLDRTFYGQVQTKQRAADRTREIAVGAGLQRTRELLAEGKL